jgi:hypothetical protein
MTITINRGYHDPVLGAIWYAQGTWNLSYYWSAL